jgi:uncharacterized protein
MVDHNLHPVTAEGTAVIADPAWAFLTGLFGSLHCLGMCGPVVVTYSLSLERESREGRQARALPSSLKLILYHAAFHGGRIATYILLAGVAGSLVSLAATVDPLLVARSLISAIAGAGMIMGGLVTARVFPASNLFSRFYSDPGGPFPRMTKRLFQSPTIRSKALLGSAAGSLPCMLSWSMVLKAATAESITGGLSTVAAFGLGTIPVLLLAGFVASFLTVKTRIMGERVAALSIAAMGLILLWKGIGHFAGR